MIAEQLNEISGLVTFEVKVGETIVTDSVQSISTCNEVNKIPWAKIILSDGDHGSFELSASQQFESGNPVEIKVGYHQAEYLVFQGEIVKQTIRYRNHSMSSLSGAQLMLECRHTLISSTKIKKSRVFKQASSRSILSQILKEYGAQHTISSEGLPAEDLTQFEKSDWSFITDQSKRLGWFAAINTEEVVIGPPDLGQEPNTLLDFGKTIIELDADFDAGSQLGEVVVHSWDTQSLKQNEVSASLTNQAYTKSQDITFTGELAPSVMGKIADGIQLRRTLAEKRGRVKCSGIGSLKIGDIVALKDLGAFEGTALVTGIMHNCTSGLWHTEVQFGLTLDDEENYRQTEGQKKDLQGLFIGTVKKIVDDPNQNERILVQVPAFDKNEGVWARMSTPDAGEARGWNYWPEKNDEVILGFLQNDPDQAVILGCLHGKKNKSAFPPADGNGLKGYKSKSGLELTFNDDKSAFQVQTKQGSIVKLSDSEKGVLISDEHNNAVMLHEKGITITSQSDLLLKSKGDVKIEGNNVSVEAKAQGKIKASSGLELSSNAIATMKGNPIKLN